MSFLGGLLGAAVTIGAVLLAGPGAFGITGLGVISASTAYAMAATFGLSTLASRIFAPNVPQVQDNGVRQQVAPDTSTGIPIVYGDAYLGAKFCDAVLSIDQKTMYYVMAVSCISPNGQFTFDTTKFYYSDKLITFDGSDNTKVVSLTDGAGNVDTKISGNLYISLYKSSASGTITGLNTSVMPSTLMGGSDIAVAQRWASSNRQMNGLAFAIIKLNYNRDAGTTQLSPITFHASQYLNSTGVAKPGDVWYDYMTNSVYGGAVNSSFVDTNSVTALNNYSDELISFNNYNGVPSTQPRYRINGVLDTGQTCLSNVDKIMMASDSWMQYNAASGKWAIVINKAESTSLAFNDTNIVGSLNVGAIDITQSINQIEARFNDKTNRDQANYVNEKTPTGLLYPNEPVNKYTISYDLVNDSVQALYLANRILEQAREDLIVSINTTYVGIQVNAGDVVSVTNSAYGWNAKLFRVMKVQEASLADGNLGANLQLNEYNAQVYDDKDITQYTPAPNSGLAAAGYFSALSAPVVGDQQQNAAVPSFSVSCLMPTTGRVTNIFLYYTTTPTPDTTDWTLLGTQSASNSEPFVNSTYVKFTHISLPTNTYYFAFKVSNEQSQSVLSAMSSSFYWLPNPTTSAVAGTFIATFSPTNYQIPYQGSPNFTGVSPQLYGTTSGGSVDFTAAQTDAAMSNDTWRIGGSPYTGYSDIVKYYITIGNPTDGGNYALFPSPTAMTSNNATLSVPVRYKDSLGNVVQGATATLQFTFAFQGQSARICYSKTSLTSLASSPATITTSGNTSYPPDTSWGSDTHWVATAPTITAGESVYQSDGVYNPVLDETVWNVPYLSNLKVGQLSAISALMGTLTAGTITAGSSASLQMGDDSNGSVLRINKTASTILPPAYMLDSSTSGAPSILWLQQSAKSNGECLYISPTGGGVGALIADNPATNTGYYLLQIQGGRSQGQMLCTGIGTGGSQHGGRFRHYNTSGGTLNASAICATEGGAAFYAETGGYAPFTGVHDGLVPNGVNIEIGDILVDTTLIAKNGISDTLYEVAQTTMPESIAIGIYAGGIPLASRVPASMVNKELTVAINPVYDPETGALLTEEYINPPTEQYEQIKNDYQLININAVGEGQINVCGENGNIARGDLIVTSSTIGKGMKQADDIIRNYTVARAREAITFSSPNEVKMIACVYLCG